MRGAWRWALAALLVLSLAAGAAAEVAPVGYTWLCMFRGTLCEFRNDTTTTCSLVPLNGTCSRFLDGALSAQLRRAAPGGPVMGPTEPFSLDVFLDTTCSPLAAIPLGFTNITTQECR